MLIERTIITKFYSSTDKEKKVAQEYIDRIPEAIIPNIVFEDELIEIEENFIVEVNVDE